MPRAQPLILYSLLFLAFFQLLSGLIEATYAFGLLQVDIPPEIGFVLFLLSPLVLIVFPGWLEGRAARNMALLTGLLALYCWGLLPWLDTRGRLLAAGLGTGLLLLFLPALLRQAPAHFSPRRLGCALGLAGLLSILLYTLGGGQPPAGLLARAIHGLLAGLAMVLFAWFPRAHDQGTPQPTAPPPGFWRVAGAWLGLLCALALLYFGFTTPAVIARWAGADPAWVILLAAGALALLVGLWSRFPGRVERLAPRLLLGWNGLFVLALAGALLPYQVAFPADPAAYPLAEPPSSPLAGAALAVMLLLHPVLYVDFGRLAAWLAHTRPAPRAAAGGLALSCLGLLVALFTHVFTTVYDYIPVAGPWFRDRFWLVYTLPAIIVGLSTWLARAPLPAIHSLAARSWPARYWLPATAAVLLGAAGLLQALDPPRPVTPTPGDSLRVMTYNIQQGYTSAGQPGLPEQLALIQAQNPDLVGVQESDMARIANGNVDALGYLASGLDMHAYAGPRTVTGTFGIALLSRYPIENPRTFYLYSESEQTAAILAEIQVGPRRLAVIVTHLGNGGPPVQQQQVLALADGRESVVMIGDFNFSPDTPQYRQTTAALADAWLAAGEQVSELPEGELDRRIDHVFLSPGLPVLRAHYLAEGLSDHPALVVKIRIIVE
jgi:endonuclease/exonuclease/phosphatase family metal-dependent hydrolase